MEWIVPLIATTILALFFIYFLAKKNRTKEIFAISLVTLSMLIYHIGDLFLWSEWMDYEIARRIASIGFYLEIPFMILLMYLLLPKEKHSMFMRIASTILFIPWIVALLMICKSPIVFLENHGEFNENFVYLLILCFVISIIFIAIKAFRANKFREDKIGKKLSNRFAIGVIVYTVLYLIIFSSMETFGQDLTWLFGIASIIFVFMLWHGSFIKKES
ncbi:hypothetical protein ACFL6I_14710 [candidate division KSB1 bacterium]